MKIWTWTGKRNMVKQNHIKNNFYNAALQTTDTEVPMAQIGTALLGSDKYQYVLPFEFISVFLLACIIGGIMIARKEDNK